MLSPLSRLYGLITDARNVLFDRSLKAVYHPTQFVIGVGNLTVGGTGKTPMVEYLLHYLLPFGPVATLSRGYGRQTTGFRLAQPTDTAQTLGDEPLQLYRKFGRQATICVGERRAEALDLLRRQQPELVTILLDDAFQHRAVAPQLNLLLMDYNRPFYQDHPFPGGRLRERRHGASRADAVVVTKCPDTLAQPEIRQLTGQILRYSHPNVPIFFTGLAYSLPIPYQPQAIQPLLRQVVLVSGIARADELETYVAQTFGLQHHHRFGDHHAYTRADVDTLLTQAAGNPILTTEKDRVKLDALLTNAERVHFYYLPVALRFLAHEAGFRALIHTKRRAWMNA